MRRLSDGSFIVLHPKDCDICADPLVSAAPEWTGIALGQAVMVAVIPAQAADGVLVRSQVTLSDTSLGGLLGSAPIACTCTWETLIR